MTRAILYSIVLLLTPGIVKAAGWSADMTVTSAFTEATTDLIVIYTSGGGSYTAGCAANAWIFTATTDARRARGYSTIMAALVSGQKLRVWFTDACSTWGYHEATVVMLVQ